MIAFTDVQIGFAIKSARMAAECSAKTLAERCGFSPATLSKIESGKRSLSFSEAVSICGELGIRVDHLVALAHDVETIAIEAGNIREQLKKDLRILEQRTIKHAIAANAAGKAI